MAKTGFVNARIDKELKEEAEKILERVGLSKTQAIQLFYRQICLTNGLPFPVRIPDPKTKKAIDDLENGRGNQSKNIDSLLEDLNS